MNKVKRFSLEERYGYQNRKVIYDKNADNDIELNNIYLIIDLFNQLDEQIADLQHRLEVAEKALELACEELMSDLEFNDELDKHYNLQANIEYFKTKAMEVLKSE